MYVCMYGSREQKGEGEDGGSGGNKGRWVSRPQKSIGWEERAKIICTVRGQRGRANRGGGDSVRHRMRHGVQRQ